ncbi:hypothetical protein HK105_200649 [Polyrhizophydium stewartii]|uniref:EF-hand domain-containing protein n=1 Tax=Polyrhizophydium stewartii TaxID=2732419 RepID=A0ABR4NJN4_9FUNG|nr:Multiple coagulation factor deficiency protein 2 [Polyrhizophydium stewartii]
MRLLGVLTAALALLGAHPGVAARLSRDYGEDSNYGDIGHSAQFVRERLQKLGYGREKGARTTETPHAEGSDKPLVHKQEVFYFFSLHDYNGDGHLDGHELRLAFQHYDREPGSPETFDPVNMDDLETMIDHALAEDDLDNDGKISWDEYLESQSYHRNL